MLAFGIGAIVAGILAGKETKETDYSAGARTGLVLVSMVVGGACADFGATLIGLGREEVKERREWKKAKEYWGEK